MLQATWTICNLWYHVTWQISTWLIQVAQLQGLSDTAADQVAAASASALVNGDASAAEQWLKQQADSLAAQSSKQAANAMPAWQLAFLPDVMTRVAAGRQHDAPAAAAAAAAAAHDAGSTAVQANQQEGASQLLVGTLQPGPVAPDTSAAEGSEQHVAPASAALNTEPVSWLQWEQHLQVRRIHSVSYT